jgi:hypothetical protein
MILLFNNVFKFLKNNIINHILIQKFVKKIFLNTYCKIIKNIYKLIFFIKNIYDISHGGEFK